MELSAEQKEYLESLNGDVVEAYKAGAEFMKYDLEQELYFRFDRFKVIKPEMSFDEMLTSLNWLL